MVDLLPSGGGQPLINKDMAAHRELITMLRGARAHDSWGSIHLVRA